MALTDKQKAFAKLLGQGASQREAAIGAGYKQSPGALAVTAHRLAHNPEVQAVAFARVNAKLRGPLSDKAAKTLEAILDDESAPAPARVAAAKFVLESAGHGVANRAIDERMADGAKRTLADMDNAELERIIREGEAAGAQKRSKYAPILDAETGKPLETSD